MAKLLRGGKIKNWQKLKSNETLLNKALNHKKSLKKNILEATPTAGNLANDITELQSK